MYETILSTCHLYRNSETDPANLKMVDGVIQIVTTHLKNLKGEGLKAGIERIGALSPIISIITGIVGLTIFTSLFKLIEEQLRNVGTLQTETLVLIIIIEIISGVLVLPLIWVVAQYKWYGNVMRIMDVKKNEETVHKSLYPLQREILDTSFQK